MKNKIKKLLAILTVACFMLGFAVIPVSAAAATSVYTEENSGGDLITVYRADQLWDLGGDAEWTLSAGQLFPDDLLIYPGEAVEFGLNVITPAALAAEIISGPATAITTWTEGTAIVTRYTTTTVYSGPGYTVTMACSDKTDPAGKDLADCLKLIVSGGEGELPEGTGENALSYYTGDNILKFDIPGGSNYNMYYFKLVFDPEYEGGNGSKKYMDQNELMDLTAEFEIKFSIVKETRTLETSYEERYTRDVPQANVTPDDPIVTAPPPEITDGPPAAAPAAAPPAIIISAFEPAAEPAPEPAVTESAPAEEYDELEDAEVPLEAAAIVGPPLPSDYGEPAAEDEADNEAEDGEEFEAEDAPTPLEAAEFIDRMPTTGENINPFFYYMTGLMFVLAGGITMVGAGRTPKEENERQNRKNVLK